MGGGSTPPIESRDQMNDEMNPEGTNCILALVLNDENSFIGTKKIKIEEGPKLAWHSLTDKEIDIARDATVFIEKSNVISK